MRRHAQSDECQRAAASWLDRPAPPPPVDGAPELSGEPGPGGVSSSSRRLAATTATPAAPGAGGGGGGLAGDSGASPPAATASALGKRTQYECDVCGKSFLFTQLDVMRHQAAHRAAGEE